MRRLMLFKISTLSLIEVFAHHLLDRERYRYQPIISLKSELVHILLLQILFGAI